MSTLRNPAPWLIGALGGVFTDSGQVVTTERAVGIPALFNAIRLISESIAVMPVEVLEIKPDGTFKVTRQHPAAYLFNVEANPNAMWPMLCDAWITWKLLWGNGYLKAKRDAMGDPIALDVMPSDATEPTKRTGSNELVYKVSRTTGGQDVVARRNVIHLPGFSFNGVVGHSAIYLLRESLGENLATAAHGRAFWQNGAMPGGYIKHPAELGEDGERRLRESWENLHRGTNNAHRVAILEEGAEYHPTSVPMEDAQFLQTKKFQVADVARIFRVPLHKLQEMDRSTFGNIEHQALEFLTDTLVPIVTKAEAALNQRLFAADQRGKFRVRFKVDHILRADSKARAEFYVKMRQAGAYNADMVLADEGKNPLPDGRGQTFWMPSNHIPAPTPEQADMILAKHTAPKAAPKPPSGDKPGGKDGDDEKDTPDDGA